MPERSHLSIGEVLTLLRDEFPDVTISKIRFLESQGLVDPERTPSGYRKFYDQDVERLRWILRQQREHFLPLKVIRGRLSEGSSAEPNGTTVTRPARARPDPRDRGEAAHLPGLAPPANEVQSSEVQPEEQEAQGTARKTNQLQEQHERSRATVSEIDPGRPLDPVVPVQTAPQVASSGSAPTASAGDAPSSRPSDVPSPRPSDGQAHSRPRVGDDTESFSAEELAAAAGADSDLVTELKQYGLITVHTVVAGTPYFDQTALAVTKAAAGFAKHGVEARHLRAWRNSADREVALFEQLIMPLLRQRNPQARRQAAETIADLSRLGGDLRDALLERALKDVR